MAISLDWPIKKEHTMIKVRGVKSLLLIFLFARSTTLDIYILFNDQKFLKLPIRHKMPPYKVAVISTPWSRFYDISHVWYHISGMIGTDECNM